ncbi:PPP family 3-phenylpropionic acid transporter [Mobilisporobacter senegalensis]|uniref:PPP family 3-phenylpropionic acid transporter n=1 Tax=Mobilisporobacter senegalensis TaxID=1329262 RepID=A0A3N1Y019_9FIRM|nr:MFS transporter [Mobilisporobacter senegalensis]ROR31868.1 PPP family 3-phenylpropionic acid transporter [Mobilisporobacter senegalensis]
MMDFKSTATKLTVKYLFLQAFLWMSFGTIWSFATTYLLYKGFQNTQVGIILSIGSIISIGFQPFIASFIDKFENLKLKSAILALIIILFILALALWLIPYNFYITGFIYILIGVFILSLPPLIYSIALEYINLGININFGLARGIGSISFAFMVYVIGIATSNFSPTIILPVFAGLTAITGIIVCTFESPLKYSDSASDKKKKSAKADPKNNQRIFSFFITYKRFSMLLIGFILLFISHSLINTYHINIISNVGGNDADMGLSIAIAAALELPVMVAFSFIVSRINCSNLLKISAFFFMIKIVVTCFAPNVGMIYLSQLFQLGSYALFVPASVYYVNDIIDESNKVKGQALLGAATMGAGGTLANFIGGRILDSYNVTAMLVFGIISAVIGFGITLFFTDKTVDKEEK